METRNSAEGVNKTHACEYIVVPFNWFSNECVSRESSWEKKLVQMSLIRVKNVCKMNSKCSTYSKEGNITRLTDE